MRPFSTFFSHRSYRIVEVGDESVHLLLVLVAESALRDVLHGRGKVLVLGGVVGGRGHGEDGLEGLARALVLLGGRARVHPGLVLAGFVPAEEREKKDWKYVKKCGNEENWTCQVLRKV